MAGVYALSYPHQTASTANHVGISGAAQSTDQSALYGLNLAKPQNLAKRAPSVSLMVLEHVPQVRFACLTTHFASVPPLFCRD